MKSIFALFLAVFMCVAMFGCAQGNGGSTPDGGAQSGTEAVETTPPTTEATMPVVDQINMTTDKGSLTFDGVEMANAGLCRSEENVVIFKFTFTSNTDRPSDCQSAFQTKYYQDGVEIDTCSFTSSDGGDHYDLCGNYFNELMKGGVNSYARPVSLKSKSPVTIIVTETGNPDNYQAMEVDVSDLDITVSEEATVPTAPAGAISLTTSKGSIQYLGHEKANEGLVNIENAVVFKFVFTNYQAMPSQGQSAFRITYFQNGVEIDECTWISSDGGEQYELCSQYFQEVMKGGVNVFGRVVELKDNSPVTIFIEEAGNPDNYQSMEVTINP